MRGPLVDVVLLTLIVAFFGVQQRRRPEAYFRFWIVGWLLVLASMVVWELPGNTVLQEALRQTLLACGGLAFVFSFVAKQRDMRGPILQAGLVAIPVCLGLDMVVAQARGGILLIVLVIAGELLSGVMAWRYLKSRGGWLLTALLAAFAGLGAYMVTLVVYGHADTLLLVALSQTFVVSGLLFATMKRKGGRSIGAAGFLSWAACYLLATPFSPHWMLDAVNSLWSIPKYLVAFGMILKLFTKISAEYAVLNTKHQTLYEDYRVLFESNPHPMVIYDRETHGFLLVNDAAVALYGFTRKQFLAMKIEDVLGEREQRGDQPDVIPTGLQKRIDRHRKANGTNFDVDITGNDITFEGRRARFVLAMDITEREELNRELVRQAHHDALTGLPNRVMLGDRIEQWLTRCVREENLGAFLTIDIDHFKRVNDTYGHQAGDECLKMTAERLRSRVRQVDTIARTGGEEFTIVIGGLKSRLGADKICSELLKLFAGPMLISGHAVPLTVSIGVALYPCDGTEIDVLRRKSDQALYRAKRSGRNQAVFASDEPVAGAPLDTLTGFS